MYPLVKLLRSNHMKITKIIRKGDKNTRVELENGTTVLVRTDLGDTVVGQDFNEAMQTPTPEKKPRVKKVAAPAEPMSDAELEEATRPVSEFTDV